MLNILYALLIFSIVGSMLTYSCWLLFHRLKSGESKKMGFWEWLKHIFEALWGI